MRGGFISNLGTPLSILVILGILVTLGLGIWGIIELVKHFNAPAAPAATTNDLDITIGSPMPQGCNGGGRIELGCNPASISINVSLNKSKPPNTSGITRNNNTIHWNLTGLDKNGLTYTSSGNQPLAKPTEFINLTTTTGIPFKTMSGTIYLTDVNKNVGNSSSFSYP